MQKEKFIDLMIKDLSGSISAMERDQIGQAISQDAKLAELKLELENQWKLAGNLSLDVNIDTNRSWTEFETARDSSTKTFSISPTIYKVAAMLILAVAFAFYFLDQSEPLIEYYTSEGETMEVELPDGSKVWLNESSQISLEGSFGQSDRKLRLSGEAFFDIKRDEDRPFIINAEETVTEVLGTSFNISAIDGKMEIIVVSGRVSFSGGTEELILTKGMAASFNAIDSELIKIEQNKNALAWKSKELVFDNIPLDQVFADLEDYFSSKLKIEAKDLSNCLFTGTFKYPDFEEVLRVISLTTSLKYEAYDEGYIISGNSCEDPTH